MLNPKNLKQSSLISRIGQHLTHCTLHSLHRTRLNPLADQTLYTHMHYKARARILAPITALGLEKGLFASGALVRDLLQVI